MIKCYFRSSFKVCTYIFIYLIFNNFLYAQEKGTLRGSIVDSTNGEALPFSNIAIYELKTGTTANSNGNFFLPSIPADKKYNVTVSFIGYLTKIIQVYISPNKITEVKIKLVPTNILLKPVERVGERITEKNTPDIGLEHISEKELEILPNGVESDIFRSLQYIPGVQSTSDISARYYVRGSDSNENLVLLDGTTIYNPFHAFGIFSVIDPDMINSAEFYKGGFPANYNGRLSSVMNIITKDGNKNDFDAKAGASFLSGKLLLEGPIPYGSFIVTGRKSFSTEILQKFLNNEDVPINFFDLSYKLNYENPNFINGSKFVIEGFSSGDRIISDNPLTQNIEWNNNLFAFKWLQITDSPLFFNIDLHYSEFDGNVDPKLSGAKPESNKVNDISFNSSFIYVYDSKDETDVGMDVKALNTQLYLENSLGAVSNIGSSGADMSVYALYKFQRFEKFGANIGTYLDLTGLSQSAGSSMQLSPRVNLTYRVLPEVSLKAAWGIYTQQVTTLSDPNEVISLFDPWVITPSYLKPSTAIHYTIGMKTDFSQNLSLDIQGYYKILHDIPILNEDKFTSTDPDLLPGSNESYGWEFQLIYSLDKIKFTGSYTLGWSYNTLNNWVYYPDYDVRNALNLILNADLGKSWGTTIVWVYNSGLPFTQNMGYYDKFYFNDLFSNWSIYQGYMPMQILADENLARLPDYSRLDLSISKKFVVWELACDFDFSIINVYNRKNIFYFNRQTGQRVNMLPFLPTATINIEI
ncbi:MAG: TonB-dependent receptor [Ignavibacteriaceae bacterium]